MTLPHGLLLSCPLSVPPVGVANGLRIFVRDTNIDTSGTWRSQ